MTNPELNRYFRPHSLPASGVPLGARSMGLYKVFPGWRDDPFCKSFFQIFWGVEGCGRIIIEGEECHLTPGTLAVYVPGMLHQIEAMETPWVYRWWTVDGREVAALMEQLGLRAGIYEVGAVPEELFVQLERVITGYGREDELKASALAYELLCLASSRIFSPHREDSHYLFIKKTLDLCRRYWSRHDCNVNFLADKLGIHRSRLSRIFSASLGMGPNEFLTQMRMDNACSLLRETSMPVSDIARQCGFADPDYFARIFKKRMGVPARLYREQIHGTDGQNKNPEPKGYSAPGLE